MNSPDSSNRFFLAVTAERMPHAPAIVTTDASLAYADLDRATLDCASHFLHMGIHPGERVALLAPTGVDTLVALLSLLRIGAVVVPVSTRFPAGQVHTLLAQVECQRIIVAQEYTDRYIFNNISALTLPSVCCDNQVLLPSQQLTDEQLRYQQLTDEQLRYQQLTDEQLRYQQLTDKRLSTERPTAPFHDPSRDATMIFTSGSSGLPKAVVHTLDAHLSSAAGSQQTIPLGPGDCWLLSLPLFHVGGFAVPVRAFQAGAAVAVPPPGTSLHDALAHLPLTHLSLVATQLYRLLRDDSMMPALRRLKAILLGGSAMPHTLIARALDAGLRIHTSYGCTEMASQVTTTEAYTTDTVPSSGRLLPFRELRIGEGGELLVRGETLMRGYAEGGSIRSAVDADGWYHTRDTGFFDESGCLHVTGRIDNMFISGGENIQPEEVEQALCSLPDILQALVVPIADDEFGARPVAFLWLVDGACLHEQHLREQLAQRIARFSIPVYFFVEPPVGEHTGKLNRQEYRRRAESLISVLHRPHE